MRPELFDGLAAIRRFANQTHILLIGDERRDSFAYQSVVVNRQNANYSRTNARLIDFCINNGIIGTGGIRLCPDRVEALIYWKIGASGLWLC